MSANANDVCYSAKLPKGDAEVVIALPHDAWEDCLGRCKAKTGRVCGHPKARSCARCRARIKEDPRV